MVTKTYTWTDLFDLQGPWEDTFGEPLSMGFMIYPSQVPLLRRCIKAKSQDQLDKYIADKMTDGRMY